MIREPIIVPALCLAALLCAARAEQPASSQSRPDQREGFLLKFETSKWSWVRLEAAQALLQLKDKRAVPVLVPFLKDSEINYKVAWTLGETGDQAAIAPLVEALGDNDPDVRVPAINALAKLGARSAVPRLRLLLEDAEKTSFGDPISVGAAAEKAITTLEEKP